MFVWARGLCGLRISCHASVDCSRTTGKINVVEIEVQQGAVRACYHDGFHHGAKHSPPGSMGSPDCLEGVPPLCCPGDPLAHVI